MSLLRELFQLSEQDEEQAAEQRPVRWNPPAPQQRAAPQQRPQQQEPQRERQPRQPVRPQAGDLVLVTRNNGQKTLTIVAGSQGRELMLRDAHTLKPFGKVDLEKIAGGVPHKRYTRGQVLKLLGMPSNPTTAKSHVNVFNTAQ